MKVKESEQTITREEAINLVMRVFDTLEGECNIEYDWRKEHEARDMAIKALEQEQALDKAIAEIDKQGEWLAEAGYNAYNVDIAFGSIIRALRKMC